MRKPVISLRNARSKPCYEVRVTGDPESAYAIADEVHSRIRLNLRPVRLRLSLQWNNGRPFWSPMITHATGGFTFPVECPERIPKDEFRNIVEQSIKETSTYRNVPFLIPTQP